MGATPPMTTTLPTTTTETKMMNITTKTNIMVVPKIAMPPHQDHGDAALLLLLRHQPQERRLRSEEEAGGRWDGNITVTETAGAQVLGAEGSAVPAAAPRSKLGLRRKLRRVGGEGEGEDGDEVGPSCNGSGGDAVSPSNGGRDTELGDSDKDIPGGAIALVYVDSGGGKRSPIEMVNRAELPEHENGVEMRGRRKWTKPTAARPSQNGHQGQQLRQ